MVTREFFDCACRGEGLIFEYDSEYKEVSIALWNLGHSDKKLDWKQRIRWCWNIIRKGLPWADEIIMTPKESCRLAETILAIVKDD